MTEALGVDDFGPQTLSRCKDRTIPVADAASGRLLHRGDDFPCRIVEIVGRDDGKP